MNKTEQSKYKSMRTDISYKFPSYMKHPSTGICQVKEDESPFEPITILSVVIAIIAFVVILVAIYCLCKFWSRP